MENLDEMTVDSIDQLGIDSVTNLEGERGNIFDTIERIILDLNSFSPFSSPISSPIGVHPEYTEHILQAGFPQPLSRQLDHTKTAPELVS